MPKNLENGIKLNLWAIAVVKEIFIAGFEPFLAWLAVAYHFVLIRLNWLMEFGAEMETTWFARA